MQTKLTLFLLLAACSMQLAAQNTIVGKVVDKSNQPVVGVIVTPTEGGTTVTTDLDGQFEIAVEEGVSLSAASMGYRTTTASSKQDMTIVLGKRGMTEDEPGLKYGWRTFFSLNYAFYPDEEEHHFGFTLGQCRVAGWYVSAMLGTGFHFSDKNNDHIYIRRYYYDYYNTENYFDEMTDNRGVYGKPVFTGKTSNQYASVSAGVMVRLGIPLYYYGGLGYAYHSITYETTSGVWLGESSILYDHMLVESGLKGNIKGVTLSAGIEMLFGYEDSYGEFFQLKGLMAKVGVGFALPNHKMNERLIARREKKGGSK